MSHHHLFRKEPCPNCGERLGLWPLFDDDQVFWREIPVGTSLLIEAKGMGRHSYEQHKFWFGICSLVYQNSERIQQACPTIKAFRDFVLCKIGHCDTVRLHDGTTLQYPRSIAYPANNPDGADEAEFQGVVNRTLELFAKWGFEEQDLRREYEAA